MAENKGKTKGAIMSAVQSAQLAVGSALKGGQMAMGGGDSGASQSIPLLEDLRSIGRENEKNTESMLSIFKAMFIFDKEQAARLRDQGRENAQEKPVGPTGPGMKGDIKELKDSKGIPGVLAAAAALTALAAFARGTMFEDLIRLPGQLKGIKGMATFASGVSKIGTLGLGAKFIDNATDSLKLFKTNFITRLDELKLAAKNKFAAIKMPAFTGLAKYIDDLDFVKFIKNSKGYSLAVSSLKGIKAGINGIITPMKAAFGAIFGFAGGGGGPAGAGGGGKSALSRLFAPLKAIGKIVSKLFLPITIIMGIFDGYQGFVDEFQKEGSILDGIRGAVTGIVDGFIGGLVRLVTDAIGWMLEKLGFEHLATIITDFGNDITASFSTAVGGLVDFVTGIFSLDLERITKGLKNLVGGTADFLFTLVTTPVDAAIAFVQDLFNLGDPENPFTIRGFLFGDETQEGIVNKAVNFVKDLFNMDGLKEKFANIKASVLDFGKRAKAVVAASAAFVKAGFPGGESPTEAYKRVFDEVMNAGGSGDSDVKGGEEIVKSSVTNVEGDTTETTYKTETLNRYGKKGEGEAIVYVDNSNKVNNNARYAKSETYTGSLTTGTDPYFDREALNGA